jgi:hypothetical protein
MRKEKKKFKKERRAVHGKFPIHSIHCATHQLEQNRTEQNSKNRQNRVEQDEDIGRRRLGSGRVKSRCQHQ